MQNMFIEGLELPEELQVLAEDRQCGQSSYGDALCASVRKVRYQCEPEWYHEVEPLEEWLKRGGKITRC